MEKEKAIEKRIKEYLKTKNDLFYWKEHGGMYTTAGIPDLIVCYKGRFIALEVKTPIGKPTVLQNVAIRKINEAGGIAAIVRSVEDAKVVIESVEGGTNESSK